MLHPGCIQGCIQRCTKGHTQGCNEGCTQGMLGGLTSGGPLRHIFVSEGRTLRRPPPQKKDLSERPRVREPGLNGPGPGWAEVSWLPA